MLFVIFGTTSSLVSSSRNFFPVYLSNHEVVIKMLLDGAGEVVEMFRNSFPLSFLFFVPILILISPVSPAHDFAVYRMQQYDLQGSAHGMTYYTVIIIIIIIIITTTIYLENLW